MNLLKMFRDWISSDQDQGKFSEMWTKRYGNIWGTKEVSDYHLDIAYDIYLMRKEIEMLRMKCKANEKFASDIWDDLDLLKNPHQGCMDV